VTDSLSFGTRFILAFVCFFRVLFDGQLAARVSRALGATAELPPGPTEPKRADDAPQPKRADVVSALQLMGLLQREGRLVDFLQQDVASFPDADIGAAARVVHEGCRKALRSHADVEPIREEEEGASLVLEKGFDASRIKLTGSVAGEAPYRGVLRHRGWQVTRLELPKTLAGHDPHVVAPAEVEL
jgi:hypothetical protein